MTITQNPEVDQLVDLEEAKVHRTAYTNPEIFTAEMDRIFASTWVYVGHASEIPKSGDYKSTQLGCRPVIMSRSANGEINVMMNRCRHRGALVCQAEKGNARFFRCEYHGWTYRNSGELVGVTVARQTMWQGRYVGPEGESEHG